MQDNVGMDILQTKSANILVVDDEELIRSSLSRYLEKKGYHVQTAENGEKALEKMADFEFDLVITDLKMPIMDGRVLLKIMSERHNDIPRIVLTAVGSDDDILHALKTGAYDFLSKPIVDYKLLYYSVARAVERKRLNDEKNSALKQLEKVNDLVFMLNKGMETEEIFKSIYKSLMSVIPLNRLTLFELDVQNKNLFVKLSESDRKYILSPGENISISDVFLDDLQGHREIRIFPDLNQYIKNSGYSEKLKQLADEGFKSVVAMPIVIDDIIKAILVFFSDSYDDYTEDHKTFLQSIAGQIGFSLQRGELLSQIEMHSKHLEHLVKVRTHEVLKTQKTTIFALSKLAEIRDNETGEHLERMRNYCVLLSQLLKYTGEFEEVTNDFLKNIYDSSILHDIGKVGIPDAILLKPDSLTPNEFEMMKTHTSIGFRALQQASEGLGENSFLNMAMDIPWGFHQIKYRLPPE